MKIILILLISLPALSYGSAMPVERIKLISEKGGKLTVQDKNKKKYIFSKRHLPKSELIRLKSNMGKIQAVHMARKLKTFKTL